MPAPDRFCWLTTSGEHVLTLWHATVSFIGTLSDAQAVDIMEALHRYGAATTVDHDFNEVTITLTLDADTILTAATKASAIAAEIASRQSDIIKLEVASGENRDFENPQPLFPHIIGIRGITRLAGVSARQAHKYTASPSFPRPVAITPQGPLYWAHAVERWLEKRTSRQPESAGGS